MSVLNERARRVLARDRNIRWICRYSCSKHTALATSAAGKAVPQELRRCSWNFPHKQYVYPTRAIFAGVPLCAIHDNSHPGLRKLLRKSSAQHLNNAARLDSGQTFQA